MKPQLLSPGAGLFYALGAYPRFYHILLKPLLILPGNLKDRIMEILAKRKKVRFNKPHSTFTGLTKP